MSTRAVHWVSPVTLGRQHPVCGMVRGFSCNTLLTSDREGVTCRACMYIIGRYMPLVRLKDHQHAESAGRAKYGKRDPYYVRR